MNKDKEINKKRKKENFSRKRWIVFKQINRVYWLLALVVLVLVGLMIHDVKGKYNDTLHWKKNDPGMTMANQSLDLLYDKDPKSKESKLAFDSLRKTMINGDGQLTEKATRSNLKKLRTLLNEINTKNSEKDYKKLYAEVALKYSLKQQYENLFVDIKAKKLDKTVTPSTIAQLNESAFNDLQELFVMNNNDKFVSDYVGKITDLFNDVDSFNALVDTFNSAAVINSKNVTLKDGYRDNLTQSFTAAKSKLIYNWEYTDYMSTVVIMLNPIVAKTISAYNVFDAYQTDMANKDAAYTQWRVDQETFFEEVKQIHKQAIAEKRAREEAARIAKQLADAKQPAKDLIDKYTNMTSDQKTDFKKQIDNADTIDKLNSILDAAKAADAKAKDDADKKKKEEEDKNKDKDKNKDNNTPTPSS